MLFWTLGVSDVVTFSHQFHLKMSQIFRGEVEEELLKKEATEVTFIKWLLKDICAPFVCPLPLLLLHRSVLSPLSRRFLVWRFP